MIRLLALLLSVAVSGAAVAADEAAGPARVLDPATIVIGGLRIRLAHVTPPVEDERCGPEDCAASAKARLTELVGQGPLRCSRERRLGHGVYEGRCRLWDGSDVAEALLTQGLARPAGKAPAAYIEAARGAEAAGRGLWVATR